MWCGFKRADTRYRHKPFAKFRRSDKKGTDRQTDRRKAYPAMSPHVSITHVIFLVFLKHCCLLAQRFGRLSAAP